jgi:hypothetical protein
MQGATMETKQYIVNGKTYTLTLKQSLNGAWEAAGFDPAGNEVMRASERTSRRDAQFAAHVRLYELHSIRQDQQCEQDCEKGWTKIDETRPCPHRDSDGKPCSGTQTYRVGRPINAAGTITASGADTSNMNRRPGWECDQEYPEHFDVSFVGP